MGAYLSKPSTEKQSSDDSNDYVSYGASSMQGWRVSQEDAHNTILNFDEDTCLFAVYDGHGGHEVAAYTAIKLPEYIKRTEAYGNGNYSQGLIEAFLEFDASLVEPETLNTLKEIAGAKDDVENSESEGEEVDHLCREAAMPLEEVMAKYGENPRCGGKFQSPNIRAKKDSLESSGECSGAIIDQSPIKMDLEEQDESLSEAVVGKGDLEGDDCSFVKSTEGKVESDSSETKSDTEVCTGPVNNDSTDNVSQSKTDPSVVEPASVSQSPLVEKSSDSASESLECDISKSTNLGSDEGQTRVNGDSLDHEINGEVGLEPEVKSLAKSEDSVKLDKEDLTPEKTEQRGEKTEVTGGVGNNENGEINGELEKVGRRKGKGKGSGTKGKSVMKPSDVRALRKAQNRSRETEADEIYKKIQDQIPFGACGSDDESDEDDEEDDNFCEEMEEEEVEEEEEDNDEANVDEDPNSEDDVEDEDSGEEEEGEETDEREDIYSEFSMNMREEPGFDSGCTACIALLRGSDLYVANVGDSRCVVCRDGKAVDMSIDHKPEDETESSRIKTAGGHVTPDGRVNGGLNLSRAIGDHGYKQNKSLPPEEQMISPLPDVKTLTIDPSDQFMIVACDGIWNSMSSQEACDFISKKLENGGKLSTICEEMFDFCLAPDVHGDGTGCDNMTCIIVKFGKLRLTGMGGCKRTSETAENDSPIPHEKKVKGSDE